MNSFSMLNPANPPPGPSSMSVVTTSTPFPVVGGPPQLSTGGGCHQLLWDSFRPIWAFLLICQFLRPLKVWEGGVQFGLITPYDEHFCSHDFHCSTSPDASFGHTYPVQCSSFGTIWSAWLRFSAPHSTSDVQQFGNAFAIPCGFTVAYSLFVGCTNHHGSTTSRGRGIWIHVQSSSIGYVESGQATQVHG